MTLDRVQPLKIEDTASGGDELDSFPTGLNRNEDYVECRGSVYQNNTSNDESVRVDRDVHDNLVFEDPIAGSHTLSSLLDRTGDVKRLLINSTGHVLHDAIGELVLKVGP